MIVRREDRDGIAVLSMNRGKVNALDTELLQALSISLDEVEAGPAGAVVLTGDGSAFSAGVDLVRLMKEGTAYVREFIPLLDKIFRRLFAFPKPTVAAVNGHAIAGGYVLMAACDRRVMARANGKVGVPELLVGVPFPPMALEILRSANPAEFHDLIHSGTLLGAEEALSRRVVDALVPSEELRSRACNEAGRLASIPSRTYGIVKRERVAPALERAAKLEIQFGADVMDVWESPETAEVIRAYLARTISRRD